ncbi:MAG: Electron transfer flavoprotein-quinone oxidoreductase, partial [uncultured Thermomicrobiales bacterium]
GRGVRRDRGRGRAGRGNGGAGACPGRAHRGGAGAGCLPRCQERLGRHPLPGADGGDAARFRGPGPAGAADRRAALPAADRGRDDGGDLPLPALRDTSLQRLQRAPLPVRPVARRDGRGGRGRCLLGVHRHRRRLGGRRRRRGHDWRPRRRAARPLRRPRGRGELAAGAEDRPPRGVGTARPGARRQGVDRPPRREDRGPLRARIGDGHGARDLRRVNLGSARLRLRLHQPGIDLDRDRGAARRPDRKRPQRQRHARPLQETPLDRPADPGRRNGRVLGPPDPRGGLRPAAPALRRRCRGRWRRRRFRQPAQPGGGQPGDALRQARRPGNRRGEGGGRLLGRVAGAVPGAPRRQRCLRRPEEDPPRHPLRPRAAPLAAGLPATALGDARRVPLRGRHPQGHQAEEHARDGRPPAEEASPGGSPRSPQAARL